MKRKAAPKENLDGFSEEQVLNGLAFAELIVHMDKRLADAENTTCKKMTVFKLAELASLYQERLLSMGLNVQRVHSTRLKEHLLAHFPDIHALQDRRDILLGFNNQLGGALKNAYQENYDDEAVHLARAAQIVRRDILKITSKSSGSFDKAC